jgi:2-hydroxychromene-2-carboxylate isomerase
MRAATWAKQRGAGAEFALAAYRRAFVDGHALTFDVLAGAAAGIGLPGDELRAAVADPEIKAKLRETTDAAWSVGVRGVPTVRVGDAVYYGDDELERAAEAVRAG